MSPLRKKRLESSIKRELALLVLREQDKYEGMGFPSIQHVDLAKDFSTLKVYLSFFANTPKANQRIFDSLKASRKYFQNAISRSLRLRFTPQLVFLLSDDMMELPDIGGPARISSPSLGS